MSDPINVNVNIGAPGPVHVQHKPGCLLQLIYFIFIGWWLGGLAISLAYFLFIPIITIPLGVKIINRIPYLMALREPAALASPWGVVAVQQRNILLRSIWFILIGFWLAALWMSIAYFLCLTIIGMPAGFWMFDKTPAILTLRRSA
jgi:uncharacterized membrane protein YccF (DUF307 family)